MVDSPVAQNLVSTQEAGPAGSGRAHEQTVTALVENEAGVLARVVGLFARRGFNITSLAVAPTENPAFSRITFVYDIGSAPVQQVVRQVDKLINVVRIEAVDPSRSIERELLLARVCVGEGAAAVHRIVVEAGAEVVEESEDRITVSLAGAPTELDRFEAQLRPFGIADMQRTGRVALVREHDLAPPAAAPQPV